MPLHRSIVAALLILLAPSAQAQREPLRPVIDVPFGVSDAFGNDPGELDLEGGFRYQRGRGSGGLDSFRVAPEVQLGVFRGLEIGIGLTDSFGNSTEARRGGTIDLGGLYQFTEAWGALPALAISGGASLPYGPGGQAAETELAAVASWTTGRGPGALGLHLNAGWLARPSPAAGDRPDRYRFAAALVGVVGPDTALAATYAREQQERGERDLNLVEIGARHRLTESLTLGLAGGFGVGRDSPRFQILAGFEYGFSLGGR